MARASSWRVTLPRTSPSCCGPEWKKCWRNSIDPRHETRDTRATTPVSCLLSPVSNRGSMKTYQYMWRMIRFRPWLYLVDGVLWTAIHVAPVLPGLVAREILDTMTGNAQLGLS